MNIDISLTDFVDFVAKSGSPKLTLVKQIKNREKYHPSKDYWKILRDELEVFHREGKDKKELDKLLTMVDKAKLKNYTELISLYKSFLGKKKMEWFEPNSKQWKNSDLSIRLNPELGLKINGKKYLIKLYFKAEGISKSRVDPILTLLSELKAKTSDYNVAVLDIRSKKLYTDEKLNTKLLLPLLKGEAGSFETIWNAV